MTVPSNRVLDATNLKGVHTPIVTPFEEDGENVDYKSLENVVEFQIAAKVQGIVICGSTGEAATLSEQEFKDVVVRVRDICSGRVPCVAGIGTNNTKKAKEIAIFLDQQKLDGILLVAPPYVKPTQEGILEHFRAVHSVTSLPIIAYNIPGRTGCNILPTTIARLSEEKIIIGLKDSTGSIEQLQETVALVGESISILSGEDLLVHALMACGGEGVISATANIVPESFVQITSAALMGNWEESLAEQIRILPVVKTMFSEPNPIPVKAALKEKGIIKSSSVRLPLTRARPETIERIRHVLSF